MAKGGFGIVRIEKLTRTSLLQIGIAGPLSLVLAFLLLCTGCCYDCRWADAGKIPTPADTITGRWTGTWKSEASGHEGGLRSIVTPSTPGHYHADFHATFAWIDTPKAPQK